MALENYETYIIIYFRRNAKYALQSLEKLNQLGIANVYNHKSVLKIPLSYLQLKQYPLTLSIKHFY